MKYATCNYYRVLDETGVHVHVHVLCIWPFEIGQVEILTQPSRNSKPFEEHTCKTLGTTQVHGLSYRCSIYGFLVVSS